MIKMKSTLRLFNALPVEKNKPQTSNNDVLKKTLSKGYILSPEVTSHYTNIDAVMSLVESEIGLSAEEMNAAFHKSWEKVKSASIEQLVIEQILHYITTYGFEALGIYDKDYVYIPVETLDIPKLELENLRYTVIRGYTKDELKKKLIELLQTGIALKDETIKDIVDVAMYIDMNGDEIEKIKNREVKIAMYGYLGVIPKNPVEFLRYAVYKATENTLLIKNKKTIEAIKEKENVEVTMLFKQYEMLHGFEPLASIFNRFKPLFLAFKTNTVLSNIINKISKLSKSYHSPMPEDYLNSITARIKNNTLTFPELRAALKDANIFRKIRLAYALKYRTKPVDSIVYKVRNGKSYVTDFTYLELGPAKVIYNIVEESIVNDLRETVDGKKIYIPKGVTYALPATEKQFTGNIPSGTCVSVPNDMIFGVHWKNVYGNRIDLDLSLMNANIGKIGWDVSYRTTNKDILFSGDVVDPLRTGATELFYISKRGEGNYIMHVNYYNHNEDVKVPYSIVVAKEKPSGFNRNYVINPNNVICIAKSSISDKQKILGLIVTSIEDTKFYFVETSAGGGITSSTNEKTEQARKYLFNFYTDTISLNDTLLMAGAQLVSTPNGCDIDLSPETLEKSTIINLIK